MDIYDKYSRYDSSNVIHDTAIIHDNVVMGKNNVIGAYAVIGGDGEIRGCDSFEGAVEIGDNNIISEMVTIQRPSAKGAKTVVGSNNILMAHTHIGHDAVIGDGCEISTSSVIGGYAQIEDAVRIKLNVTVRNRKIIGKKTVVGMGSVVISNLPSDSVFVGNPAKELKK